MELISISKKQYFYLFQRESVFPLVCFRIRSLTIKPFFSGSLASSIFDPFSGLVGASGGVYALLGGYFMNAIVVSIQKVPQADLKTEKPEILKVVLNLLFADKKIYNKNDFSRTS